MTKRSFVTCALTCATDGSEEDEITCFKVGQPCSKCQVMLKSQLEYMNSTEPPNPIVSDEEDNWLHVLSLTIDEDIEEDEDINSISL